MGNGNVLTVSCLSLLCEVRASRTAEEIIRVFLGVVCMRFLDGIKWGPFTGIKSKNVCRVLLGDAEMNSLPLFVFFFKGQFVRNGKRTTLYFSIVFFFFF